MLTSKQKTEYVAKVIASCENNTQLSTCEKWLDNIPFCPTGIDEKLALLYRKDSLRLQIAQMKGYLVRKLEALK